MTDEGAARPEPTIADAERIIRKIEACSGMAAKLVLLRNFIEFSASSSNAAPNEQVNLRVISDLHSTMKSLGLSVGEDDCWRNERADRLQEALREKGARDALAKS